MSAIEPCRVCPDGEASNPVGADAQETAGWCLGCRARWRRQLTTTGYTAGEFAARAHAVCRRCFEHPLAAVHPDTPTEQREWCSGCRLLVRKAMRRGGTVLPACSYCAKPADGVPDRDQDPQCASCAALGAEEDARRTGT